MNKTSTIDVSIIIINYNTFRLTTDCIRSIIKETTKVAYEIIVVDNGSVECAPVSICEEFPQVILIEAGSNLGFSRGNNLGIEKAKGKYILLLNSDTIILDGAIDKCIQYYEQQEGGNLGLLGCKLLNPDRSLQVSCFTEKIGYTWLLKKNPFFYQLFKLFGNGKAISNEKGIESKGKKAPIIYILGAFMLTKKNILERIGPMDPDFFMYYEEYEWCHRFRKAGLDIQYYPEATVIHIYGGSSKRYSALQQQELSRGLFFLKTKGRFGYLTYLFLSIINVLSVLIVSPFKPKGRGDRLLKERIFLKEHINNFSVINGYGKRSSNQRPALRVINK